MSYTEISSWFSIVFIIVPNKRRSRVVGDVPMMRFVHACWHSAPVETKYRFMIWHWHTYIHRYVDWIESSTFIYLTLQCLPCWYLSFTIFWRYPSCFVDVSPNSSLCNDWFLIISSKANIGCFHLWFVASKKNLLL